MSVEAQQSYELAMQGFRARRGVLRGWIPADAETMERYGAMARRLTSDGRRWLLWGFADTDDDDAILGALAEQGAPPVTRETFREQAAELPGPYELAEAWSQQLVPLSAASAPATVFSLSLCTRALWARWCPDLPALEIEADRLEEAMATWLGSEGEAPVLEPLERLAEAIEGSEAVLDAIDEEMPVPVAPFLIRVYRDVTEAERQDRWDALAHRLDPALGHGLRFALLAAAAGQRARGGDREGALGALVRIEAESDERRRAGVTFEQLALAHAHAGNAARAIELAEERLRRADTARGEASGIDKLRQVLQVLGLEGELTARVRSVGVARAQQDRAERRRRRRGDKGPRRR